MKCEATSKTTHSVLISKEIGYQSYKEICSGEPKKVNLGYNSYGDVGRIQVKNNSLVHVNRQIGDYISGLYGVMSYEWEVLGKFFSIHNIEQNWLHCNFSSGYYDEGLKGWTGCTGKV